MPGKQILLDGSATLVHSLVATGLIDEFQLLVHPHLVGEGKNFYQIAAGKIPLFLKECRQISTGVVLLNYTTKK
jgi:riboflavin biosynthesis pyrimidine reductase